MPQYQKNEGHQTYRTLCIGDDVIVPATGVRGFLRYILMIATGGPLVMIDTEMFLCQGRDQSLGQRTPTNNRPCLARVITPGNARKPGVVQIGESNLIRATDIESIQWARWGRRGTKLTDILPGQVMPDYLRDDGKVSTVTDLFGQVPVAKSSSMVASFAGRIRPDNLVFEDAAKENKRIFGPVPIGLVKK